MTKLLIATCFALTTACTVGLGDEESTAALAGSDDDMDADDDMDEIEAEMDAHAVLAHVRDADGNVPSDPDSELYNARGGGAIIAPDGHHITLGEWVATSGEAEVECEDGASEIEFVVEGLFQEGVYTAWQNKGAPPLWDAAGVLGDGEALEFENGATELEVVVEEGALSIFGSVSDCVLDSEYHIGIAYHTDFETHGPVPGPPSTWVVQAGFPFVPGTY